MEYGAFSINIFLFPNLINIGTIASPHPYIILLSNWNNKAGAKHSLLIFTELGLNYHFFLMCMYVSEAIVQASMIMGTKQFPIEMRTKKKKTTSRNLIRPWLSQWPILHAKFYIVYLKCCLLSFNFHFNSQLIYSSAITWSYCSLFSAVQSRNNRKHSQT